MAGAADRHDRCSTPLGEYRPGRGWSEVEDKQLIRHVQGVVIFVEIGIVLLWWLDRSAHSWAELPEPDRGSQVDDDMEKTADSGCEVVIWNADDEMLICRAVSEHAPCVWVDVSRLTKDVAGQ